MPSNKQLVDNFLNIHKRLSAGRLRLTPDTMCRVAAELAVVSTEGECPDVLGPVLKEGVNDQRWGRRFVDELREAVEDRDAPGRRFSGGKKNSPNGAGE
jgi:hypothetical protein